MDLNEPLTDEQKKLQNNSPDAAFQRKKSLQVQDVFGATPVNTHSNESSRTISG